MKKTIILGKILMLGLFVTVANQSCTNLDEDLFDTVTSANFPKTDEEYIAALGAAYTSLYGMMNHGNVWSVQEVSSDEMIIPQRGTDWFDGGQWLRTHQHDYRGDEDCLNNAWNFCFGGISTCNRLISLFTDAGGANSASYIAELKTLRALYYYWLLDMFGNVPIVTSFKDAPTNPATESRANVYAFVESELNTNIPLLDKTVGGAAYGRMNYWTGKAIQAKLYLNAEVYTGTAQWQKALDACNEIVNSGKFNLEGSFFNNFKTDNGGSKENIYAIPYDKVYAKGFNLPQMTLHYGSQATFNLQQQPWNGYCSLSEFYNTFDNNDVRKKSFIAGQQYASDGVTQILDPSAEPSDPDGQPLNFTPEVNALFPNCLRQAGVRVGKYEFALGATPDLSNDYPIFRYADILLMKVECHWRLNQDLGGALALLNTIRTRAGVAPFASLNPDDLYAERGREMFAEAWRRNDMIRFGKYLLPFQFKDATDQDCKKIFPIPNNKLSSNPNLDQNPCY